MSKGILGNILNSKGFDVVMDMVPYGGIVKTLAKACVGNENATEEEVIQALPSDPHELEKLLQQSNIEYAKIDIQKEITAQEIQKTTREEIRQDIETMKFFCSFIKTASRYKWTCIILGLLLILYSIFVLCVLSYIFFAAETFENTNLRDGTQQAILGIIVCLILLPAGYLSRHVRKILNIIIDSFLEPVVKAFAGFLTSIMSIPGSVGNTMKNISIITTDKVKSMIGK